MVRWVRWLAPALLLLVAGPLSSRTVVVMADRMLDVVAGRYVANPRIVVTDGRIVSLDGSQAPAEAERIDLSGLTLLPGLVDMHTHLTSDPRISRVDRFLKTDGYWTLVGAENAAKMLRSGFTTVRNLGSARYDDVALK